MGKNTRHQSKSHAQLVVVGATQVSMLTPITNSSLSEQSLSADLIENVPLDVYDEVLLTLPKFDENDEHLKLGENEKSVFSALSQAWLINQAEYVQMSNAHTDLTNYEMLAYVNAPLYQQSSLAGLQALSPDEIPSDIENSTTYSQSEPLRYESAEQEALYIIPWATYIKALELRSILEIKDNRRNIRSIVQLENICNYFPMVLGYYGDEYRMKTKNKKLVPQFTLFSSKQALLNAVAWRCNNIYTSCALPWWYYRRTYADYASSAGLRQSALNAFIQIGLWEKVIEAYLEAGNRSQAEALVRSRLPNRGYITSKVQSSVPTTNDENTSEFTTPLEIISAPSLDESLNSMQITEIEEENENLSVSNSLSFDSEGDSDSESISQHHENEAPNNIQDSLTEKEERDLEVREKFLALEKIPKQMKRYKRGLDLTQYKLWALLGDITNDKQYYERSWVESKGSYPKAKRSLGMLHYAHGEYELAFEDFMESLEINSSIPDIWYIAGVCALTLNNFKQAADCFTRVVSLSPRYPEGWNNLAACHLYLGNNRSALGALEHATQIKRDSWKMFENMLHCALDLKEYGKAITCLEKLADLRGTVDSGTLLPIQYNGQQAKLHMMAIGELTKAAEEDARNISSKNQSVDYTNEFRVLEESFLSHRVITVLHKLESIATSMVATEASLGGRKRGGGTDAGASNSVTAQLETKDLEEKAQLARGKVKQQEQWLASQQIDSSSDDESDDKSNEENDKKAKNIDSEKVSQQYSIFIQDCLVKVHVGVHNFTQAAQAREKQTLLLMNNNVDGEWATNENTVNKVHASFQDCIHLYKVASQFQKHIEETSKKNNQVLDVDVGHLTSLQCLTAARYLADRILTLLTNIIQSTPPTFNTCLLENIVSYAKTQKVLLKQQEDEAYKTTQAVESNDPDDLMGYFGTDDASYW